MSSLTFKRVMAAKYVSGTNPTNNALASDTTSTLIRQYNDSVIDTTGAADPTQIAVFFNGQEIGTDTTSKYFYSLSFLGTPPTGFIVTLSANSAFIPPGYDIGTTVAACIGPEDIFYIDYTYTLSS